MADRVVRLEHVFEVKHATRGDKVVLLLSGQVGSKRVRVEIALDHYDQRPILEAMRAGTGEHLARWVKAKADLQGAS